MILHQIQVYSFHTSRVFRFNNHSQLVGQKRGAALSNPPLPAKPTHQPLATLSVAKAKLNLYGFCPSRAREPADGR